MPVVARVRGTVRRGLATVNSEDGNRLRCTLRDGGTVEGLATINSKGENLPWCTLRNGVGVSVGTVERGTVRGLAAVNSKDGNRLWCTLRDGAELHCGEGPVFMSTDVTTATAAEEISPSSTRRWAWSEGSRRSTPKGGIDRGARCGEGAGVPVVARVRDTDRGLATVNSKDGNGLWCTLRVGAEVMGTGATTVIVA